MPGVLNRNHPIVSRDACVTVENLGSGFRRAIGAYGFMETPDIPKLLSRCRARDPSLTFRPLETTYILGRETLLITKRPGMSRWRKHLFSFMARNSRRATDFFNIPPNSVLELGTQVEI